MADILAFLIRLTWGILQVPEIDVTGSGSGIYVKDLVMISMPLIIAFSIMFTNSILRVPVSGNTVTTVVAV
jgi:hypothetical protein